MTKLAKILAFCMLRKFFLFFLCALGILHAYADAPPVVISPDKSIYKIENFLDVYRDKTDKLTIQNVSASPFQIQFTPYDYKSFPKYRDLTTWLKFSINNPLPYPVTLLLNGDVNLDNSWKFYASNESGAFAEILPPEKASQVILYPLKFPAFSTQTYYLKRFTEGKNAASYFLLEDPYKYVMKAIDQYFVIGINFGIPLALLLHSFFIFFITRDRNYLIYIMFVISCTSYSLLDNGLLNRIPILQLNNWWYFHLTVFFITCVGFFYSLFAKSVLQAKKYAPVINTLMRVHAIFFIPIFVYCFAFKANELIPVIYVTVALILSAILNIITLVKGYKPARYYFIGMIFVLFWGLIGIMSDLEIVPRNAYTANAPITGLGLDMILQAIALAARFNLIKEEEAKAQAALIKQKDLTARVQAESIKEQQQLIDAYERFVPHDFLDLLHKKSVIDIQLGDQVERQMAVLFSDIRNFTTVLEHKNPAESFKFINDYLGKVGPIIRGYNGFVDKYIGDAIMALFRTPADPIYAAIKMIQALKDVRQDNTPIKSEHVEIGVGIHYGLLMLGTVGEKERMDGTVISDTVNTAFRIEELNKTYDTQIIISEKVYDLINKNEFKIRFLDHVYVKGKSVDIKIYEVFDTDPIEVIEKKLAMNKDFEAAMEFYRKRDFKNAIICLQRCQKILPTDQVLQIYIRRCEKFLGEGVATDWQPIIRLLQKGEFEF